MGYRGYEHSAIAPRFAFGHGLSYTSFRSGRADVVDDDPPARWNGDGHAFP